MFVTVMGSNIFEGALTLSLTVVGGRARFVFKQVLSSRFVSDRTDPCALQDCTSIAMVSCLVELSRYGACFLNTVARR